MILKSLELDFFRNYTHLEAFFDPRVNLIYGDNAQGKTNLLEAVAYLSSARSHRARYDREMILLGVDAAFLKGELSSRGRDFTLEAKLFRGKGGARTALGAVPAADQDIGKNVDELLFPWIGIGLYGRQHIHGGRVAGFQGADA